MAVFDAATGEILKRTQLGRPHEVMELLEGLPGPVRAVYEAGPTGYGLARRSRPGLEISVCAPGEIPAGGGASSRIKTDARDVLMLARLHAAGQLAMVADATERFSLLRPVAGCERRAGFDPATSDGLVPTMIGAQHAAMTAAEDARLGVSRDRPLTNLLTVESLTATRRRCHSQGCTASRRRDGALLAP